MVSLLLVCFAVLAVVAWLLHHERTVEGFTEQILLPLYVSFLLPILCLCYATASIAGDREEQTLVYALITPLPRPLVYSAKYGTALLLVMAWTLGSMAILCGLAGPAGRDAFRLFWPAVFWSTVAYVGLFHVFSVVFRRATIVALTYALFLETFLGNMPGTVKRVAVSFYTQCLIYDRGSSFGLGPAGSRNPALFLPVSGRTALAVLCVVAGVLFVAGMWLFSRREYT